ncbi:MAG: peptidoglycan editing factor PgeF [Candidatus Omnitrophica bacterium]|nr:peptidoglycan editing factor PgeF [Candidatus Omnitrophota bacterium]MBU1928424.1 peptidoglycan editing factor PgeF [Candidatus Omnitrophota bacterium]MBU2034306.1 peptidoglycan editing factor PgeF [Candidatus Omnitrophota bacterium]
MAECFSAVNKNFQILSNKDCIAIFSWRSHGNMSLVYGDTCGSIASRSDFLTPAGIKYQDLVCAKQTHSNNIYFVNKNDSGKGALFYDSSIEDTDALVTNLKSVPLAIFTADCLPVSLYDPKNNAIGLVHASWRSSQADITAKTVMFMQDKFNTSPEDLRVNFGPAIRACCFQVGDEFRDIFPGSLISREKNSYLDLTGVNRQQLLDSGVNDINISDSGLCTYCNENDFFSFRREGKSCGRMMSVLMLK